MKIPLRFQITEFDCGAVSLLNCLSFLYEREEIPAVLIKKNYRYALDRSDESGNQGNGGTSERAVEKITEWLNAFSSEHNFNLVCEMQEGENVSKERIAKCLNQKGVILVKLWQEVEHYIIVTKMTKKKVYIFDPYYMRKDHYRNERDVRMVFNKPFSYNRVVSIKRFFSESHEDFALGPIEKRECVLFNKC